MEEWTETENKNRGKGSHRPHCHNSCCCCCCYHDKYTTTSNCILCVMLKFVYQLQGLHRRQCREALHIHVTSSGKELCVGIAYSLVYQWRTDAFKGWTWMVVVRCQTFAPKAAFICFQEVLAKHQN